MLVMNTNGMTTTITPGSPMTAEKAQQLANQAKVQQAQQQTTQIPQQQTATQQQTQSQQQHQQQAVVMQQQLQQQHALQQYQLQQQTQQQHIQPKPMMSMLKFIICIFGFPILYSIYSINIEWLFFVCSSNHTSNSISATANGWRSTNNASCFHVGSTQWATTSSTNTNPKYWYHTTRTTLTI